MHLHCVILTLHMGMKEDIINQANKEDIDILKALDDSNIFSPYYVLLKGNRKIAFVIVLIMCAIYLLNFVLLFVHVCFFLGFFI